MIRTIDNNTQARKKDFDFDMGKRNIGFKFSEALMEAVDDSFDSPFVSEELDVARCIEIHIYEEEYEELTEESHKKKSEDDDGIKSKRYSYAILDNGPGTNIDNVFDFGQKKEERFTTLEALNSLNGLFHYGISSHLNVGTRLYFYSRQVESEWWLNCLEGSDISDEVFTYKQETRPNIKIDNKQLELDNPDFYVRTLVHVKGVRKSEIEAENQDELVNNLVKQFGITYRNYIERGNKILINGKEVKAIDPFLQEYEYTQRGIGSDTIHQFEISLSELLEKEDAIVKQSIIKRYGNLFENKEELLNQTIKVDMFHLSLKFIKKNFKSKIEGEMPNSLLPSKDYSGFYIKRNLRYIGRAAKILDICSDHNSFNYFRAEIAFSPIFDTFFGIQVNKNKYDIKSSLASLIISKINEKTKKKLGSFLKEQKNKIIIPNPLPLLSRLKIMAQRVSKTVLQLAAVRAEAQEKGIESDLISEAQRFIKNLEEHNSSISAIISNFHNHKELDTDETKVFEDEIIEGEKVINESTQMLARLKNAISLRHEQLIEPAIALKERVTVAASSNRRLIMNIDSVEHNNFQGYILEPLNEVQMYGVLYKVLHHFPGEFDFVLLDYSESKFLDCVVKIKELELYNELNFKDRFENQWELEWDEYLLNNEGAFSFVELKYRLGEKEDLGHSMTLVSHLICWDFHENNLDEFKAIDGKYKLSSDKSYLFHKNKMKKIKVICLKKLIEDLLGEEFNVSKDDFINYLSR